METLPVRVSSQRCSMLPFFTEDCLLWKYLFYFPLSKDFPSCMKSPVEGETQYSASLHFCAFGLLECIVNNQRNKGTWMAREEAHRYREWTGSALGAGVRLSFHADPLWPLRVLQLGSQLEGWVCLGRPSPEAAELPGTVWFVFMPVLRTCRNLTGVLLWVAWDFISWDLSCKLSNLNLR